MRGRAEGGRRAELTAMIPAITTGTMHFIMRSGLSTPMAAIPTPLLDVPYDAPMPVSAARGRRWGEVAMEGRGGDRVSAASSEPPVGLLECKGRGGTHR